MSDQARINPQPEPPGIPLARRRLLWLLVPLAVLLVGVRRWRTLRSRRTP